MRPPARREAAQSAAATEPGKDELTIINGGVAITVTKIDASQEKVNVRQLPLRFLMDWGALQSEETELAELLSRSRPGSPYERTGIEQTPSHHAEMRDETQRTTTLRS